MAIELPFTSIGPGKNGVTAGGETPMLTCSIEAEPSSFSSTKAMLALAGSMARLIGEAGRVVGADGPPPATLITSRPGGTNVVVANGVSPTRTFVAVALMAMGPNSVFEVEPDTVVPP